MSASESLLQSDEARLDLPPEDSRWRTLWRALTGDKLAFFAMLLLALLLLLSLLGPDLLGLPSPEAHSLRERLTPPIWQAGGKSKYLLGTDHLGRDMISRMLVGTRVSFTVAGLATLLGCVIGSVLGMMAGFLGGWTDRAVMFLTDVQLSFPALLLAMLLVTILEPGATTLILALGLNGWMLYARVARAQVLAFREQTFVEASIALGNTPAGTLWRHILPNALPAIVSVVILELARLTLAEASLSFLGFGVQPPTVSLGLMLNEGKELLTKSWWMAGLPGLAIAFFVLLLNLVANRLQEIFNTQ